MTTKRKTFPELRWAEWQGTLLFSSLLFLLFTIVVLIAPPLGVLLGGFSVWWVVRRHREAMARIRKSENLHRQFGGE